MALEAAPGFAKRLELIRGEKPLLSQNRIERRYGMSFGKDEAVSAGLELSGVFDSAHLVEPEGGDHVDRREAAAGVTGFGLHQHINDPDTEFVSDGAQILRSHGA